MAVENSSNFHESYLAGQRFDITTPGLKTDYRSAALPTALPGPLNGPATDGRDGQRMERWVDLHVYMCVRACVHVCATLPACM